MEQIYSRNMLNVEISHLNPIEKKFKAEFRYSILESIIRTNLTAGSVELVTELTLFYDPPQGTVHHSK
jgi:hypothetical protein